MRLPIHFAPRFWTTLQIATLALMVGLCLLGFSPALTAQEHHIITFEAPGADTTAGDLNGTFAASINNLGAVVGSYADAVNVNHGFLRRPDGKFITFQAPGADTTPGSFNGSAASSINDFGVIAGEYFDASGVSHGFLRSPEGKFTTFDVPGVGGFGTTPLAINLEGVIVGYYSDANLNIHAFLRRPSGTFATWDGPGACNNGNPNGCFGSGASNINFFGLAVGGYEDNKGNFVHHDLVRSPDGKLSTFDVPGAGTGSYQGTGCPGCATGFNQSGAIAGTYIDGNSVQHGFLRNREGKFTTFDAPGAGNASFQGTGCSSDCPTSLNDLGQITGVYVDADFAFHGYLRNHEGKVVTIDPIGSAGFTVPFGINDFGAITGYYLDANGVFHSFLRIPDR
jgi:hypothetical protein